MADEIKISIIATDGASKVFEDVVGSAEKMEDAFKPIDGSGMKKAREEAIKLKPRLDDVRDSGLEASDALDPIPERIDDMKTSADDADAPMSDLTTKMEGFGSTVKDIGEYLPGTTGKIVEGLGKVGENTQGVAAAFDALIVGGTRIITTLGPVGVVASLTAAGISALYLTGILGGSDGLEGQLDAIRAASDDASASINDVAFSLDNAAQGFEFFQQGQAISNTVNDLTRLYEIASVFQGGNPTGDFASGAVDGITSYNEAIAESNRLSAELGITFDVYNDDLGALETKINGATTQQELFNNILTHTGPGAADARDRLSELNAQYLNGEITLEDYNWQVQWINDNLVTHYDALAAAAEAQRQYAEAAFASAESVGLLDTALEQMAAAGLRTDATMVALNLSTSALDSTFGTIVGTTNKLASGSQQVADWITDLTDQSDGLSKVGQLYVDGRINLDEYSGAMASATRINEANNEIQQEVLAIQTKHAPLLAELTEQQKEYIEGLGDLAPAQQIAALGFMDAAQSARAMELAQLAAKAASGELGDTGTETASKIITAAANSDPVMRQMLIDMGLISEGAEGEVSVNFPNATSLTDSVDGLSESIDALTLALGGIPPSVTTDVSVNDNATSVIDQIKNSLIDLDGTTSTVYVNTVGGGLTVGVDGARNGGMVGYANGGMVMAELGEAGAELVRLANGGVAMAPTRGLYMIERGSNVLPAEATKAELQSRRRSGGGNTYIYSGQVSQRVVFEESSYARRRAGMAGRHR